MIEFPFHKQDEHMQVFRNAWQLNLTELLTKFILGEKIVLERGNTVIKLSSFDLCVFLGASSLAFKIMGVGGS